MGGGGDVVDVEGDFDRLWANRYAVVGRLKNGSVKAWGHEGFGGHLSSADAGHIENGELVDVTFTSTAFAEIPGIRLFWHGAIEAMEEKFLKLLICIQRMSSSSLLLKVLFSL